MSSIQPHSKSLNFIAFPWKYKKKGCNKLAAWAAFFFVGWAFHPFTALQRCFKKLMDGGKTNSISKEILSKDPIAASLATFNNTHVSAQVNGIYITTNETHLVTSSQLLQKHPRPFKAIHIGCATWHNFDIICARKSSYGLIVDFNPKNAEFIAKTLELLKSSASREIFKQQICAFLNSLQGKQRDLFFHKDQQGLLPTDRIEKELHREGSWLQTEESFQFIKKLCSKGRLVAITEDITNYKTFGNIRKFLERNNIAIDSLYLSNICNFMHTNQSKHLFVNTIKQLLQPDTIFISCPKLKKPNSSKVTILQQQPLLGRVILNRSYDTSKLFIC